MTTIVRLTGKTALQAFVGWVDLVLPTLTGVMLAKQDNADASRLTLPYATVERTRSVSLASHYRRVGDTLSTPIGTEDEETEELEITGVVDMVVELAIYGDTAPELMDTLDIAKGRLTSQAYLSTAGIGVRAITVDSLDLRSLRDTVHEPAAVREYAITYTAEDLSSVGTITSAVVMGYDPMATV